MKPLSIEEIKQMYKYDWLYIVDLKDNMLTGYYRLLDRENETIKCQCLSYKQYFYFEDYGKTWVVYKNKEQAECKGELVELPLPIDTVVYVIPCFLRNKEITQYKILAYMFDKFRGLTMELSIVKKQKGLNSLVSMSVKRIGNLIFEKKEQAEEKLKELIEYD